MKEIKKVHFGDKCIYNAKAVDLGISIDVIPNQSYTYVPLLLGGLCKNKCPNFMATLNKGKVEYYCNYDSLGIAENCI